MSKSRKTSLWRGLGRFLESGTGADLAEMTGGVVNRLGARTAPVMRGEIPWSPLSRPLAECRVAVVSTAGFHRSTDPPFDVDAALGDPSFRTIPSDVDLADLTVTHTHYSHRYVDRDPNVLMPLDRLRELEQAGVFQLAPRFFAFGFAGTITSAFIEPPDGTAHQVARKLRDDGADIVLLIPA